MYGKLYPACFECYESGRLLEWQSEASNKDYINGKGKNKDSQEGK